jgi:signal transduction histidine kinase
LLFLAVVIPPAVTLVWLGLRLLEQDRALAAQRAVERRDAALQAVAYSLEQSLSEAQRWFVADTLPDGVVRFTLTSNGIRADPAARLAWAPAAPALVPASTHEFIEAEQAEFGDHSLRALLTYESLAGSKSPAVRAGALLRVARVHRRERRWDRALGAYQKLALIDNVAIDGMPADLVARRAIAFVMEDAGRSEELAGEAAALERDLFAGRWSIDRAAWALMVEQLARWGGRNIPTPEDARLFSAAGEWLWNEWPRSGANAAGIPIRRVVNVEGVPVSFIVRPADSGSVAALAILPAVVESWLRTAGSGGVFVLTDDSGATVAGGTVDSKTALKTHTDTGLPWTIAVPSDAFSVADGELAGRRHLLALGLAAIVLLLAGGSGILWRVVQQQLAVAKLRTNFVSAVSHEFRTPLASLRHVTELLTESDAVPPQERRAFYDVLARNTDRLQRLVESLLDFSRMEEGRKPYALQPVRAGTLTRQVVADFVRDGWTRDAAIDVRVDEPADVDIQVDSVAAGQAIWNVLDNAVKYSPGRPIIQVTVAPHTDGIAIGVRDQGLGIPSLEQQQIFGKFVRGEQATRRGIKGTGLGLSIVSHIMQAHGGGVEVESREGGGSSFVLVFPAAGCRPELLSPGVETG